jgi:hypothetical protein
MPKNALAVFEINNLKLNDMVKQTIALYFILSTTAIFGQTKDDGQLIINKFFQVYKEKGAETAIKYAYGTNKWMDSTLTTKVNDMIVKLTQSVNLVGKFIGQEEIESRKVGSRFRVTSYFVYYQRQPIRFTFKLYKDGEDWSLFSFLFDTHYDDEIAEGIKLSVRN